MRQTSHSSSALDRWRGRKGTKHTDKDPKTQTDRQGCGSAGPRTKDTPERGGGGRTFGHCLTEDDVDSSLGKKGNWHVLGIIRDTKK